MVSTPSSPIRLAILKLDTPNPLIVEKYGDYGPIFNRLLTSACDLLELPESSLQLSYYDCVDKMEYPNLNDVDGVLLTGSKYSAYEDEPWILKLVDFTKKVLAQDRVRIIGICFGHQILGRALEVPVGKSDKGWEISVCDFDLTARGQELFGKKRVAIQQMHKDIVFGFPKGVESLGSSPLCENQGMYAPKRFVSVQGHPEFDEPIMRIFLDTRHKQHIFDDPLYEDASGRAGMPHDGVAMAAAFLKFMME